MTNSYTFFLLSLPVCSRCETLFLNKRAKRIRKTTTTTITTIDNQQQYLKKKYFVLKKYVAINEKTKRINKNYTQKKKEKQNKNFRIISHEVKRTTSKHFQNKNKIN